MLPASVLARLALVSLAACGAAAAPAPPPMDFAHPDVDPVACPEAALRELAARLPAAELTISQHAIVEAQRVDKRPCPRGMPDDRCLTLARSRPVPDGYTLLAVSIEGDSQLVEMTFDVDGRRATERAETFADIVGKLKALQQQGHKIVVIEGHTVEGAESRHAKLVFAREGGRQRRVATLRWRVTEDRPAAFQAAQQAAEAERMYVQKLEVDGEDLVMAATCADPGALPSPSGAPPAGGDVSPGI